METKEQLISNIKEWIKLDTDLSLLKTQVKEKNKQKKALTNNLVNVMKTNNIDCFDIHGGALAYKKNKVKKPITRKSLLTALQQYYKTDDKTAEEVVKHVMELREEQVKEVILHKKRKMPTTTNPTTNPTTNST